MEGAIAKKSEVTKKEQDKFIHSIKIDGSPVVKPAYAEQLTDSKFAWALENSASIRENGYWSGPWMGERDDSKRDILEKLGRDRGYNKYLESVIRNGRDDRLARFAAQLADELIEKNQAVELIIPAGLNIPKPPREREPSPDMLHLEKLMPEAFAPVVDQGRLKKLGLGLDKGTLIVRGHVGEVDAVRGGTLYVDGNVNKLTQCSNGVVYINGNLNHLGESEKIILVATGQIKEYTTHRYSAGGLQREITPSPFIFSSEPLTGKLVGKRVNRMPHSYISGETDDIQGNYVVDKSRLINWNPKETAAKALELCRERIDADLEKLRDIAGQIKSPKEMAMFYKRFIVGYSTGKSEGYYDGARSSGRGWDD